MIWALLLGCSPHTEGPQLSKPTTATNAASETRADPPAERQPTEPRYLRPDELLAIAEDSDLLYEMRLQSDLESLAPDGLTAAAWPSMGDGLPHPFVERSEDDLSLIAYPLDPGCLEQLEAGEPAFQKRDYAAAARDFSAATEQFPDCYQAFLHLGDTYWHRGDSNTALQHYEHALKLNPYSFQGQYFRANVLLKLGRRDEAYGGYVRALALRPHRPSIEHLLQNYSQRIGATYDPWQLEPRVLVETNDKGAAIAVDPDKPYWEVYGLCRAIWAIEPGFRGEDEQDGEEQDGTKWSSRTETHCLLATLEAYIILRTDELVEVDPDLERLERVHKEGLLMGLLLYEIAGRMNPDLLVLVPDESRRELLEYIETFVLTR